MNRTDLVGALDAFTSGVESPVDLGRVNGRIFVNNVSLGVYAEAVQLPEYRNAKVATLLRAVQSQPGSRGEGLGIRVTDDRSYFRAIAVKNAGPFGLPTPVSSS